MGDVPTPSTLASESASPKPIAGEGNAPVPPQILSTIDDPGFQSQYHHSYGPSPNAFSNQLDMAQPQTSNRRGGAYNMAAMANALPQPGYRPGGYNTGQVQQRGHAGIPSPGMMQPMPHYPMPPQQYYIAQHQQVSPYYNPQMAASHQQHPPQGGNLSPQHSGYYPNSPMVNQTGYYYLHSQQFPGPNSMPNHMNPGQFFMQESTASDLPVQSPTSSSEQVGAYPGQSQSVSAGSRSNIVRGPPRKPRQSGHAIWIGNLPPQTDLMSLVHHVCKETEGLESLFLISKSNCAFANFRDDQSCVAAQQKLHDSKFQSVRLVSRLRKSTVEGATGQTAPTGPSATSPSGHTSPTQSATSPRSASGPSPATPTNETQSDVQQNQAATDPQGQKDRFFVLKSLTMEDLELSVRNGVWATQSHNEETLNAAFRSVDNVYLVFSANKSGEYFGYARMASPINNDPAAAIEFAPKSQATNDLDLPKAIPTEATESCPRGRIIDDSARGTIFWEVERDDSDTADSDSEGSESTKEDGVDGDGEADGEGGGKAWGKPFKLEWLSTTRLPFYRTRGLRNPWNSNREVKIARDGTELEPSVGRRLIGLFNRVQSPAPSMPMTIRPGMMIPGYPPTMAPAPYPQR